MQRRAVAYDFSKSHILKSSTTFNVERWKSTPSAAAAKNVDGRLPAITCVTAFHRCRLESVVTQCEMKGRKRERKRERYRNAPFLYGVSLVALRQAVNLEELAYDARLSAYPVPNHP